jgi:hypothetical protein
MTLYLNNFYIYNLGTPSQSLTKIKQGCELRDYIEMFVDSGQPCHVTCVSGTMFRCAVRCFIVPPDATHQRRTIQALRTSISHTLNSFPSILLDLWPINIVDYLPISKVSTHFNLHGFRYEILTHKMKLLVTIACISNIFLYCLIRNE